MKTPIYTNKFKKEYMNCVKRHKDMSKIDGVIESLIRDETLPFQLRDHNLYGNYRGRRSCHIEPDWILIYKIDGNEIIFERTGSHSNLY